MGKVAWIPVWMLLGLPVWAQEFGPSSLVEERAPGGGIPVGDFELLPVTLEPDLGDPPQQDDPKPRKTILVTDQEKPADDLPVGPYQRPFYTRHRPSPTTRIYLQVDPGDVEFEQWLDIRSRQFGGHGQPRTSAVRMSEEFEFGLGGRFQLDLYMNSIFQRDGANSTLALRNWSGEVRYALADWGVLPGNPTLYLEYILWNNQAAAGGDGATSSIEGKILLGDDLGDFWHWGSNYFFEHTTNGSVLETGITLSVFRTIVDNLFSAGAAAEFVYESDANPGNVHVRMRELFIGPSLQFKLAAREVEEEHGGQKTKKMRPRAHLDIEPLIGVNKEADAARVLVIFGWDF